ncbi:hypothetical protein J2T57_001678 [Natronocella acetinitrilica]|uniref:Uncharacterized protein n=1 Tax=Natronocella acetinitrilica TaxID=414046 RepID=A0AAE3G4G2_9GAMM|nr:hypothetical protein [Natronocella acetinitrilica]MCP1674576.1 hypothetical protein [Natronocella acetinitrilica]
MIDSGDALSLAQLQQGEAQPDFRHARETLASFSLDTVPGALLACLARPVEQFYLPTMVRIEEPKLVAPRSGRIYATSYIEIEGRLVTEELYRAYFNRTEFGLVGAHEVFLVEIFENQGRAARPHYTQVGWAVMTRRQYQAYLEHLLGH